MIQREVLHAAVLCLLASEGALTAEKTVLRGCLQGGANQLYVTAFGDHQMYRLSGHVSHLVQYPNREVILEGSVGPADEANPSVLSFHLHSLKQAFPAPRPKLASSFVQSSLWRRELDQKYGLAYSHPVEWTHPADAQCNMLRPDFPDNDGTVTLPCLVIPNELYPASNFAGGSFGVLVNSSIGNGQTCAQFGTADPSRISSRRVGNVEYSTFAGGGAAAGTEYADYDFHTFQNGVCYQISFEFAEGSTGNSDTGCTVPSLKQADQWKVIDPLLAAVSFSKPSISVTPDESQLPVKAPAVLKFKADCAIADEMANRGDITFSWKAENADYVQLSYRCFPPPHGPGPSILEENLQRECENNTMDIGPDMKGNRSPNSSVLVSFGNFQQAQPVSITVTVTPFSQAKPYPAAAKSIRIAVNPFPKPNRESLPDLAR